MRTVLGVVLGLSIAVGLWLWVDSRDPRMDAPPLPIASEVGDAGRLAELEQKIARLENEVRRLSSDVADRSEPTRQPLPTTAPEAEPAAQPVDGFDPRWYLAQYVRSFDAGGSGSEYFRLAVDAYATSLLGPITKIVGNPAANVQLRVKLAAMLGTKRFAGNPHAIDALIAVLRSANGDAQALAALKSLEVIGDADTSVVLERMVWSLGSPAVSQAALALIVRLAGADANRAMQRLFASATNSTQRGWVLAAMSTADPGAALDVFEQAARAETPVRMQAAQSIGKFRGERFAKFVDEWLGFERDDRVRQLLAGAKHQINQVPAYAAEKATGPPDAEPSQDHPNAWASKLPEMGIQWLELTYRPARRASALRIHEVNVAGCIVKILLIDSRGRRHEAWAGQDPTTTPGVFRVNFPTTSFAVQRVRLVIDTDKKRGWPEIDAVQLLGPDGNAWASGATASSSFGQ